MTGNEAVTLHVVSPCEHGVEWEVEELILGATFSFPACKDSRGAPRSHVVTKDAYPQTRRRR